MGLKNISQLRGFLSAWTRTVVKSVRSKPTRLESWGNGVRGREEEAPEALTDSVDSERDSVDGIVFSTDCCVLRGAIKATSASLVLGTNGDGRNVKQGVGGRQKASRWLVVDDATAERDPRIPLR